MIFPDGFGASVGAAVGAADSIVGGFVGAAVGATIGAAVSFVGGFVGAAVGASVAGVPQAVNTIVKTIKPSKILNNFVTVLVFDGSNSSKHDFYFMLILGWLAEVYIPSNLWGFHITLILSCQLKNPLINSFIPYTSCKICN